MPWTRAHHNGKFVESWAARGGMTFLRIGIQLYLLVRACPFSQNRFPTLGQVRAQAFCGTCFRLDGKKGPGVSPGLGIGVLQAEGIRSPSRPSRRRGPRAAWQA